MFLLNCSSIASTFGRRITGEKGSALSKLGQFGHLILISYKYWLHQQSASHSALCEGRAELQCSADWHLHVRVKLETRHDTSNKNSFLKRERQIEKERFNHECKVMLCLDRKCSTGSMFSRSATVTDYTGDPCSMYLSTSCVLGTIHSDCSKVHNTKETLPQFASYT